MRPRSLLVAATATLLIVSVSSPCIATGQPATGESYLGENALNRILNVWPKVAIAVFAGLLLAGMVGFYDLDWARAVFLLAAIAFLLYVFYWEPLSQIIPR